MSNIPVPAPLKLGVDDEEAVKIFNLQWSYYALATGVNVKPANQQVAILMAVIGAEGVMLVEELNLTPEEKGNKEIILRKIKKHLVPHRDKRVERAEFNTICQRDGEKIEDFVKRLKKKVTSCGFIADQQEELLKDRIIAGMKDHQIRNELLRSGDITVADMLKKIKDYQQIEDLAKKYEQMSGGTVHSGETSHETYKLSKTMKLENPCRYCGGKHKRDKEKCPAYGRNCLGCGKMNHFKKMCRSKFQRNSSRKNVRQLENDGSVLEDSDSEEQCEFVDIAMIDSKRNVNSDKIMVQLKISGEDKQIRLLNIQVDTGARVKGTRYVQH